MKTTTPSRSALARRFVSVAAIVIATTFNISAAEADKEPKVPADSHPVELPELVVTARRVEEHPLDVPAYTNVITREQIEKSGASNLIELLKSQANLSFTSFSGGPAETKVSMRGTGTDGNGRTLILIDGVRTNRPDIGQFNWLQFAVQDIDSIEVMQGPQGGYYGDNAVGGVININTRGAPQKSGGQVSALVGSNQTVKKSGSYTQVNGNAWATVSGGRDESEGYRDHSAYLADSGAVRFGYDNKKNSVTQVGVSYIENDFELPDSLTDAQFRDNPRQAGGSPSEGWSKDYRVTASNQLGEKNQSQVQTDASYFRTKEFSNAFGSLFNRKIEGGALSPKTVIKFERGSLTPGVDFNYDELNSVTVGTAQGELSRRVVSPYIGGNYALTEKITLSGVVRHEFNKVVADSNAPTVQHVTKTEEGNAYQLALNYRPTASIRVYAKYDHTYRFPATDEYAHYAFGPGGTGPSSNIFFNEFLRPEMSDNFEVGSDYVKGFWAFGGAAYHMETIDEIAFHTYSFSPFRGLNENLAKTERNGVQAHVVYDRCSVGFRARADVVNARIIEDPVNNTVGRVPLVPRWQTSETVFSRPLPGLMVELTHRYVGESSASPSSSGIISAVSFFDAKISYDISPAWFVYTGVNNLADTQSVGLNFFGGLYPNEGRFIYLGSTYKF